MECVKCGKEFPKDELVDIDGYLVCAGCKNFVIASLEEGSLEANLNQYRYAGFWVRGGAITLDGIIVAIFNACVSLILAFTVYKMLNIEGSITANVIEFIVQTVFSLLYYTLLISKKGQTLGKMALKIKVVNADGTDGISIKKSIVRYFGYTISSLPFCIGYIMAGFDEEKRALHDRIAKTRVVFDDSKRIVVDEIE